MVSIKIGILWLTSVLFYFLRWVIKEENGKLVPLFLFALAGDGAEVQMFV